MKTCNKCNEQKTMSEFYRHSEMHDGHLNACKTCVRARVKRHRRSSEAAREYDLARAKKPHRKAYSRTVTLAWRDKNEAAYKAQTAVGNAIRDGKLAKEPCLFCGSTKVHAHHNDYAELLDVKWLCAKCHHRLHAMEKAA